MRLFVFLAVLFVAMPALARHSGDSAAWITGTQWSWCCGVRDCTEVPVDDVTYDDERDGYVVRWTSPKDGAELTDFVPSDKAIWTTVQTPWVCEDTKMSYGGFVSRGVKCDPEGGFCCFFPLPVGS